MNLLVSRLHRAVRAVVRLLGGEAPGAGGAVQRALERQETTQTRVSRAGRWTQEGTSFGLGLSL